MVNKYISQIMDVEGGKEINVMLTNAFLIFVFLRWSSCKETYYLINLYNLIKPNNKI